MNEVTLHPKRGKLSNYSLDNFIAPKLSELTKCNAQDLSYLKKQWLNNFILNNMMRIRILDPMKTYLFNILRRIEGAFYEYENARNALKGYISAERNNISSYYMALLHFETFFAQLYEAIEIIRTINEKKEIFKKQDGSVIQRINEIYNASKHVDDWIKEGRLPDQGISSVWITNDGIECIDNYRNEINVKFTELRELLTDLSKFADKISNPEFLLIKEPKI